MGSIENELLQAIGAVGANAHLLVGTNSDAIIATLRSRFGIDHGSRALWEDLVHRESYHDADAWRWISDYVKDRICVLAIRPSLEVAAFEFSSGDDLVRVLAECSAFEFYVTDKAFSYMLCFNHHDHLIASGAAEEWLRTRIAAYQVHRS